MTLDLIRIAKSCANESTQAIDILTHRIPRNERNSTPTTVTLHLPVAVASTQHPAWCLACRINCFSPDVRVSVLVLGAEAIAKPSESPVDAINLPPEALAMWV